MDDQVRILCVDDETNVLKALERVFFEDTYTILTATSGESGLEVLRSAAPVQLVISDYRMPGMNGVEFLKQVCSAWPDTVRIVLSGYADTASVLAAINEGRIYKFIPKPWNDDELRVTVANALERYTLRRNNEDLAERLMKKGEEYQRLNATFQWLITEKTSEMTFQSKVYEFFQNVFQALPIAALCVNAAGHIIQTNKKAKEFFAGTGAGIHGRERMSALSSEWNRFIDRVLEQRAFSGNLPVGNRMLAVKGAAVKFSDAEDGVILAFDPDSGDKLQT